MPLLKYLLTAGIIVGVGATGYHFYQKTSSSNTPVAMVASSTGSIVATSTTIPVASAIDDTWQSYQNATLKFLLRYPIKGINAPKFTVKVLKESEARLVDGCYDEGTGGVIEHPTIGGVVFCRAIHAASTTNGNIDTEFWSTKKDARVAVITFTKKYNPASFDVNAYRAFVPTLMSTFQYPTTSTTP